MSVLRVIAGIVIGIASIVAWSAMCVIESFLGGGRDG